MDRLAVNGPRAPLSIGLTGGIGSGKSTVAQVLVACGAHLVDTDAIAHALTQAGGAAMTAIASEFGVRAVAADGALDRDHMRQMVFADARAKARLEAILHPLIGQQAQLAAARGGGKPVVYDVPLLAESHGLRPWRARVDRVLVVDCAEATQLARVLQRPGWTEDAATRVMAQQATRATRRAMADAVIVNDGLSLAELAAEVHALWALWQSRMEQSAAAAIPPAPPPL